MTSEAAITCSKSPAKALSELSMEKET